MLWVSGKYIKKKNNNNERMRGSHRHPQAVRVKRSNNQCLGWESNPDRQICALMLRRLSYRDSHLEHIIQPRFHLTANSIATATSPAVAIQTRHGDAVRSEMKTRLNDVVKVWVSIAISARASERKSDDLGSIPSRDTDFCFV